MMRATSTSKEKSLAEPHCGMSKTSRKVSADVFSKLINLAGRQRMLSQRIVLHAVLAAGGRADSEQTAQAALKLFRETHLNLVQGKEGLPGVFFADLQSAYFGHEQCDRKIRDFIELAERALRAIGQRQANATGGLVGTLVVGATPMLEMLNGITLVYEREAQARAQALKRELQDMMQDVKNIAKQARMVSFNAQIVAARAGQAGREFSVVAGELTNITSKMDDLIHAALAGAV